MVRGLGTWSRRCPEHPVFSIPVLIRQILPWSTLDFSFHVSASVMCRTTAFWHGKTSCVSAPMSFYGSLTCDCFDLQSSVRVLNQVRTHLMVVVSGCAYLTGSGIFLVFWRTQKWHDLLAQVCCEKNQWSRSVRTGNSLLDCWNEMEGRNQSNLWAGPFHLSSSLFSICPDVGNKTLPRNTACLLPPFSFLDTFVG